MICTSDLISRYMGLGQLLKVPPKRNIDAPATCTSTNNITYFPNLPSGAGICTIGER